MSYSQICKDFSIIFVCVFSAICFLAYPFWPGVFCPDSLGQIEQAMGVEQFADNHPVTMAWLMKLFSNRSTGGFYYLGFQIVLVSFCSAAGIALLKNTFWTDLGKRGLVFALILAVALTCLGSSGFFNVMIWKDTPFGWLTFLFIAAATVVVTRRSGLTSTPRVFALYICAVSAALALHFRHNAFTVVYGVFPLCILAMLLRSCNKKIVFHCLGAIIIFSTIHSTRVFLKHNLIDDVTRREMFSNHNVWKLLISNDFLQALKLGMPLSQDELHSLNEFIDVKTTLKETSLANAYYQYHTPYRISKTLQEDEFLDFSLNALSKRPFFWAYTKARYLFELIKSRDGYQTPLPEYVVHDTKHYVLNLNMREELQPVRDGRRMFWGREINSFTVKLIFWTFFPMLVLYMGVITYILVGRKLLRQQEMRSISERLLESCDLLLPVWASLCIWVPLSSLWTNNDYRYFWPSLLYAGVMLFPLIRDFVDGHLNRNSLSRAIKTP